MSRWKNPVTVFVAAVVLALGCTTKEQEQQSIAKDLKEYVAAIKKWEPKEKEVLGALAKVKRTYYADDEFVARTLKDAQPTLRTHVGEVEAFEPQTMDVGEVHQRYLDAWKDLEDSMTEVIATVEKKDYLALAKAKNRLETAQAEILTSYALLDDMVDTYDQALRDLRKS